MGATHAPCNNEHNFVVASRARGIGFAGGLSSARAGSRLKPLLQ
jgi:hypothetical protein